MLFIDIVGASRLLITEQSDLLRRLNELVRNTAQVRTAEAAGKLTRLLTGDAMALAFFTTPDAPLRCAIEIAQKLKEMPQLAVRMRIPQLVPPEIRTAIGFFFQQAIARDFNYALAYFGLAECYRSLAITSDVLSKDCLPQAKEAARKALAIDNELAEAHGSLSFTLVWYGFAAILKRIGLQ